MLPLLVACSPPPEDSGDRQDGSTAIQTESVALDYTGSRSCKECHETAYASWMGSHHQLAMQTVEHGPVLGDFTDQVLTHGNESSAFRTVDGRPVIETSDAKGERATFPVTHVFGIEPLQQYLVAFPGGRYQVPFFAWDTREADLGGQRWFHLFPNETIAPGDPLHWTGRQLNWNYQCAECHSTGLEKNYDAANDRYATTWQEISVGCEACHGRGSQHLAWARDPTGSGARYARNVGLELELGSDHDWVMDPGSGVAYRRPELEQHRQAEACGRCHARRASTTDDYAYGRPLLDTHRPALIEPDLYFPDGQIRDEVYVYGSFLQSRMYRAGVECSDCHQPHSAELKLQGDALCGQCHLATRFASTDHHFHADEQVACVDCHMADRVYMGVDDRRDHSFRVPRPDLGDSLGTPDACTQCHQEKDAEWAADIVARWYPSGRHLQPHFGQALNAIWEGEPDGNAQALRLAADSDQPPIVRASSLIALEGRIATGNELQAIQLVLQDAEALVRYAALKALTGLPAEVAIPIALPLLSDPVRGVRIEAAHIAAPASGRLETAQQRRLERATEELLAAERYSFDQEFGHINVGNFQVSVNQAAQAEQTYRNGLLRFPDSVPLRVNLADSLRILNQDAEAIALLEEARALDPASPIVRESLALAYVRSGRAGSAVTELRELVRMQPDAPRPGALLVLAMESVGNRQEAADMLAELKARFPEHPLVQSIELAD